MSTILKEISDKLGIKDLRCANLGATLIDSDYKSGISEKNFTALKKYDFEWTPIRSLCLYPELESEQMKSEKEINLSMAQCWLNGFTVYQRGYMDPKNVDPNVIQMMSTKSIVTSDQAMTVRNDDILIELLSSLKISGSKEKIIDKKSSSDLLERRGIVCSNWKKSPITLKYMVHMYPEKTEYVYFIGGSDDIIEDIDSIPQKLKMLYTSIKNLKDDILTEKVKTKKENFTDLAFRSDCKYLWMAYSSDKVSPIINAHLYAKQLYRIMSGIFLIRNYLVYADKYLQIENLKELSYSNSKVNIKDVSLKNILNKYDRIYQYCKNICFMFTDIAKGEFVDV